MTAVGLLAFINISAIFYMCFDSMGVNILFSKAALFNIVSKLSNQIVITPGNLGLRELIYSWLSEITNIGMSEGLIAAVVLRIVDSCVSITLGILFGGLNLLKKQL